MINISKICLLTNSTIEEALRVIDSGAVKIALIVGRDNKFLGTLSDGDIRRAILRRKQLNDTIEDVYFRDSTTANKGSSKEELLSLSLKNGITQIPIIDEDQKVIDLFTIDDVLLKKKHENHVVLMVGGLGSRLRPLTKSIPKPMLKVGGKPILQTIIERFVGCGFNKITMCLGYKSSVIKDYFQDGSSFGASIDYVIENKRMGTAGALSLVNKKFKKPFFVMNGDLLTNINFEQMLDFHKSSKSSATLGVRNYDVQVPYGVVNMSDGLVTSITEKPMQKFFVNAGVYILDPNCIDLVPIDEFYDMPTLLDALIVKDNKVSSYPLNEYWLDIGKQTDYDKAQVDYIDFF
jgi:dTDP-glucose pyrophosphorylase